jgi:hypothetical protein
LRVGRRFLVEAAVRENVTDLLTLAEVAKILEVSRVSASRFVKSGKIDLVQRGPRLFVRHSEV